MNKDYRWEIRKHEICDICGKTTTFVHYFAALPKDFDYEDYCNSYKADKIEGDESTQYTDISLGNDAEGKMHVCKDCLHKIKAVINEIKY